MKREQSMNVHAGALWRRWGLPYPVNALAVSLYLGGMAVYAYFALIGAYSLASPWLNGLIVYLGVLGLVGVDVAEKRYQDTRPAWIVPLTLQLVRVAVIEVIGSRDGFGFIPASFLLLFLFASFFLVAGRSFGLTGLVWLLYLLARVHMVTESAAGQAGWDIRHHNLVRDLTFSLVILLTLAFIVSITLQSRQERANRLRVEKLLYELEVSHRQLQVYAEQVAELATIEERNRLARDIHDSLGHYMTVINVQLEKAIAFRERNPSEADQAVHTAKRLAGDALQEVRRSVSFLRAMQEPFALIPSLRRLINTMHSSHLSIAFEVEGCEDGFSTQSLMTLYRAAQEGLTNIQKHAQASQVTVRLQLDKEEASLSICDNGRGFDPAAPLPKDGTAHYGLAGVRERLELIQGTLKMGSAPGAGTQLLITVPKNPLTLTRQLSTQEAV